MIHYDTVIYFGISYGKTWTDNPSKVLLQNETRIRIGQEIIEILPHNYTYSEVNKTPEDYEYEGKLEEIMKEWEK